MKSTPLVVFMCMLAVHHSVRHSSAVVDSEGHAESGAEAANESIDLDPGQPGSFAEIGNRNDFNVESVASTDRKAEVMTVSTVAIKDGADVSGGLTSRHIPFVDCEGWDNLEWMEQLKKTSKVCHDKLQNFSAKENNNPAASESLPSEFVFNPAACSKKELATMTATSDSCKPHMAKVLLMACRGITEQFLKEYRALGDDCDDAASQATDNLMSSLDCKGQVVLNPTFAERATALEQACRQGGIDWRAVDMSYLFLSM